MSGKLRVGVVGAGWWAVANHLPVLKSRSDVDLVAVCRLGRAELAKVQSVFGIPYGTVCSRLSRARRRLRESLGGASPASGRPE